MSTTLFKAVFGDTEIPTQQKQKELSESLKALPENIFNAVHSHYYCNQSVEFIADQTGKPPHLIQRWLQSGVALLKVFHQVHPSKQH